MKKRIIFLFTILVSGALSQFSVLAQSFQFTNKEQNSITLLGLDFHDYLCSKPNATPVQDYWTNVVDYPITGSPCKWSDLPGPLPAIPYSPNVPSPNDVHYSGDDRIQVGIDAIPANSSIKDLRAYIKLEVLHDDPLGTLKKYTPFVYLVAVQVRGYTSFSNPALYTDFVDTMMISYLPDQNYAHQDIYMKTYYGYYSLQVQVIDVIDVTDIHYPSGVPKGADYYADAPNCRASVNPAITTHTDYLDTWRTLFNNSCNANSCKFSTNWKLTAGISYQEFVTSITNGIPQTDFYSATMSGIKLEARHVEPDLGLNNLLHVEWNQSALSLESVPALYELEWTYVDNYSVSIVNGVATVTEKLISSPDMKYDFSANATRIITDKTSYDIPLIYKKGYLIYRVRLVRPDNSQYKDSKYSEWSLADADEINDIPVNTYTPASPPVYFNHPYFLIETPHVDDNINWNYQISFAEQGKNKSVVSYFDGLLKSRQSVTKFNSLQNQLIVAEPVYNYEGAIGLQSLPIPIFKPAALDNKSLTYQEGFLITNANNPYTAVTIDALANNPTPSLSTNALANNYYSSSNLLLNALTPGTKEHNILKAIPDAEGFPFTETTYAVDDPKRVKTLGGAGAALQLDQGHDTRFYYMDPEQTELNQYLGLNSGMYKFYEKTVTRDPNQQLSFSISNNLGKPVMTGLMQTPPDVNDLGEDYPLVKLDKVTLADATLLYTDLLYGLTYDWQGPTLKFNKTYMNEGGSNTFDYAIDLPGYEVCPGHKLSVDITRKAKLIDESMTTSQIIPALQQTVSPVSNDIVFNVNANSQVMTNVMPGETIVAYELSYNPGDVETAVNDFVDLPANQVSCLTPYSQFLAAELNDLPESCILQPEEAYSECAEYRGIMKEQITPGNIYARYEKLGTKMIVVGNDTSLFKIVGWEENGNAASVNTTPNVYPNPLPFPFEINFSPSCLPQTISLDALIQNSYTLAIYNATNATAAEWNEKWGIVYDKIPDNIKPVYRYKEWADINVGANFADNNAIKFINEFNDAVAEDYLNIHPESCLLPYVYCDDIMAIAFTEQLENIPDFETAQDFKMETLQNMIDLDPLKAWYDINILPNLPNNDPYLSVLVIKDFKTNTNTTIDIPIDQYACLQTYIEDNLSQLYITGNTIFDDFFSNINNPVDQQTIYGNFTPKQYNKFFKHLRSLYLGSRRKIAMDPASFSFPSTCTGTLLLIVENSRVFRTLTDQIPANAEYAALETAANAAIPNPPVVPGDIQDYFDDNNHKSYFSYATYIVNQLKNCMVSTALIMDITNLPNLYLFPQQWYPNVTPVTLAEVLRNDLCAFMRMNAGTANELGWRGGITPDAVRNILDQRNISMDDLCNPYLISYEKSISGSQFEGPCSLNDIVKELSFSTTFFHEPVDFTNLDIMELIRTGTPTSTYSATGVTKTLNASGSGNPVNKFDDLIYSSLGMMGSNTYTVNVDWSYANSSGNISNLMNVPLDNAEILNTTYGSGTSDVKPGTLNYTISSAVNNKQVTFTFSPIDNFPYNGLYACDATAGGACANNYAPCNMNALGLVYDPVLNTDFVNLNKYLKSLGNNFWAINYGTSHPGSFYFYDCVPEYVNNNAIKIKVLYKDDYRGTANNQYCPNEGYIYAFELTITGLDLGFLNKHDCIAAYELKRDYSNFTTDVINTYDIKGMQHPFYEKVVGNYFNYKFRKDHPSNKYLDFMNGAHLAREGQIYDYYSYFQVHGTTAEIDDLVDWITNNYSYTIYNNYPAPGGNVSIYPAKNIEYLRYKEGSTEHLYINFKTYEQNDKLRRFILAMKAELLTLNITDYTFNKLQSELPTPINGVKVTVLTSEVISPVPNNIANTTLTGPATVTLKQGALENQFHKYEFAITGTNPEISDAIYNIKALSNGNFAFIYMGTNATTTTSDNLNANKIAFLDQAYDITPLSFDYNTIIDKVKKSALLTDVYYTGVAAPVNNYDGSNYLSYLSPLTACPLDPNIDEMTHLSGTLYLAQAANQSNGKDFLTNVLAYMKTSNPVGNNNLASAYSCAPGVAQQATANSIFYTGASDYTSTSTFTLNNAIGSFDAGNYKISARRQEDNVYWFKAKLPGANAATPPKYYNIYIKTPDYIPHRMLGAFAYDVNSIKLITLENGTRAFTLLFENTVNNNPCLDNQQSSFIAYGVTDFDLDNKQSLVFENVMLCDEEDNGIFSPCFEEMVSEATENADGKFAGYITDKKTEFITKMNEHIRNNLKARFTKKAEQMKYALTLYGYDRAGNLIYTIPPEGVNSITTQATLDAMDTKRLEEPIQNVPGSGYENFNPALATNYVPEHTKKSNYSYNSLNQLIAQSTPDAGETKFYYDPSGKLAFSQNAKQAQNNAYSYTLYDNQNRIIETGETKYTVNNAPNGPLHPLHNLINELKDYDFYTANWNLYIRNLVRSFFRTEVVCTYYDEPLYEFATQDNGMSAQDNMRGRVACVATYPALGANVTQTALLNNFTVAQHYSYDLSGNVKTLTYDMPQLNYLKQRYKRIDYDYDLYSGKVNLVSYNRGFTDQYYQRYEYDDDNRITKAETSQDGLLWDKDAQYKYYPHGPLARVDLGDLKVQGIDFAYTLQGWLKSINGDNPNPVYDIGSDGNGDNVTMPDKLQHSIHYYANDYLAINPTNANNTSGSIMHTVQNIPLDRSLYNGNISATLTAPGNFDPLFTEYWYDQLNRIKKAQYKLPDYTTVGNTPYNHSNSVKFLSTLNANATIINVQNTPPLSPVINTDSLYRSEYYYDLDGNLSHLRRFGAYFPGGTVGLLGTNPATNLPNSPQTYLMDKIDYKYTNTDYDNKLLNYTEYAHHQDAVDGTDFENDLQEHTLLNPRFEYDPIGNLTKDMTNLKSLTNIKWTLYGKMAQIDYSTNEHSAFLYEPGGNRFKKSLIKPNPSLYNGLTHLNEYYIREASGNILAIYKQRQDFKMENPFQDLINDVKTNNGFAASFAMILGDNDEFSGSFFTTLKQQQNTYLVSMINAKDPSYYLQNSDAIKASMVANTPQLVTAFQGSDPSFYTNAMQTPCEEIFMPMLLESDMNQQKLFIALMVEASDLTTMQAIGAVFGISATSIGSLTNFKDQMYNALRTSTVSNSASKLKSVFTSQDSTKWHTAIMQSIADSLYTNKSYSTFSYSKLANFVLYKLGQDAGNTTTLVTYYDAMANNDAQTILENASTKEQRGMLVYKMEPEETFEAMKTESWFAGIMDNTLASMSGITFTAFANALMNTALSQVVNVFLVSKLDKERFYLAEHHMYGSSRLGIKHYWYNHYQFHFDYATSPGTWANTLTTNQLLSLHKPWYSNVYNSLILANHTTPYGNANTDTVVSTRILGLKQYELTNHLSNVMALVTDKIVDSTEDNTTTETLPLDATRKASLSATYDYYPFGMLMPERFYEDKTVQTTPVTQTIYNINWVPITAIALDDPGQISYFAFSPNTTMGEILPDEQMLLVTSPEEDNDATMVSMMVSNGIEAFKEVSLQTTITNNGREIVTISLQQENANSEWETFASTTVATTATIDLKGIPTSNTAMKVVFSSTDINMAISGGLLVSRQDLLASTVVTTISNTDPDDYFNDDYRFGYNGQHKDNEVAGIGNHNTALFWEYDTRLGRRWNIDPVDQIKVSNYATFGNNPILNVDILGDQLIGVNVTCAANTRTLLRESIKIDPGSKEMQSLFKLSPDQLTFEKIEDAAFDRALNKLTTDEAKFLAKSYKLAINQDEKIYSIAQNGLEGDGITAAKINIDETLKKDPIAGEVLSKLDGEIFNEKFNKGGAGIRYPAGFGLVGTRMDKAAVYDGGLVHKGGLYGVPLTNFTYPRSGTFCHELGHYLSHKYYDASTTVLSVSNYSSLNAIQTYNMFLRLNFPGHIDNGQSHNRDSSGKPSPMKGNVSGIPDYLLR